ncbi:hypothetical protein [Kordiimonas sp.]|uniref:hypothetical protein n=1 Tax=Kordiimonas sp. TaxID=1970157 RepID=UPI003A8F92F8
MTKKSTLDLSFEELAEIGEQAFAQAKRKAIATGLPSPYIDVESQDRYFQKIAQGCAQSDTSKDGLIGKTHK